MKVLFVASEATPFIKTGGLADVIGSLPRELKNHGIDVRVIMPKYGEIHDTIKKKMKVVKRFTVPIGWQSQYCGIETLTYKGIVFYFIDNEQYFKRPELYGYWDDGERFGFFCRAVIDSLPYLDFKPEIIHSHDWHGALVNTLLHIQYKNSDFHSSIKTVFTIHNLHYQGIFPRDILDLFGIDYSHFNVNELEFYGNVNFMKGALVHSNILTTVSKSYAEEIQTPYYGHGLDGLLRKRSNDLYGIINGIDYDEYNPESDQHIFKTYSSRSISNKRINKLKLQKLLGLPVTNCVPIMAIISRLVPQKGLDLISHVLDDILNEDIQLIVLGTGLKEYEDLFKKAASEYPDKVSANFMFDEKLARRIYAGSDFFLMPSIFEPCGIGQLIALRYGTIPIVRETGGLKDTVTSYDELNTHGNGFTFANINALDMLYTIRRAISYFQNKPEWTKIRKNAMECDNSWNSSALQYVNLYTKLLGGEI
ncbi:glycogen synthase GlgA [Desulfitibacter alkalitolerans]|uniref:glycogen synthase GlgA n=1 Tax=Desulfitibacter alkalitolerans TaxID=264641 RepID=UPI00047FF49E|nr:glycogen synthase GlgA [Desulfitibacter alkalitolerans]